MRIVNAADLRYHEGARNHSYRQPVQHGASNGACIFCTIKAVPGVFENAAYTDGFSDANTFTGGKI